MMPSVYLCIIQLSKQTPQGNNMSKQQIISAKILALVAGGMDVREALDKVCGAGSFERLASYLYDVLRAKAA